MTLVLRKLLASSTFAIAGALTPSRTDLKRRWTQQPVATSLDEELAEDYEALDETADEWTDDADEALTDADRRAHRGRNCRA